MNNKKRGKYQFLQTEFSPLIQAVLNEDRTASVWLSQNPAQASAAEVFAKFSEIDPTSLERKKPYRYLNWIIQSYLKSNKAGKPMLAEDFYKITEALKIFTQHQSKLKAEERDIGQYSYDKLVKKTQKLAGIKVLSLNELGRLAKSDIYDQSITLYKGEEGMVVVPLSRKSAEFWGKGTQWCTSATKAENAFFEYHEDSPLIIFMPKDGQRKYQYHRATDSLMDEHDNPVWLEPEALQILKDVCGCNFASQLQSAEDMVCGNPRDRKAVLVAVKQDGCALEYADDSLKKAKCVVLAAVSQEGCALEYADNGLKKDKEVVLAAVKQYGTGLRFADDGLKKDKEVVLAAVKQCGSALHYADESLKTDKNFLLAAVKQNGLALKCVDGDFKQDKDIVLAAIKQNGLALQYADESLKTDPEIIAQANFHGGDLKDIISTPFWSMISKDIKERLYQEYKAENGALAYQYAYAYAYDCGVEEKGTIDELYNLDEGDDLLTMPSHLIPELACADTLDMNVGDALKYYKKKSAFLPVVQTSIANKPCLSLTI